MRFIKSILLFFYIYAVQSTHKSNLQNRYYARYINESEWIEGLGKKVNDKIDLREQKEITSVCYYLGINCQKKN